MDKTKFSSYTPLPTQQHSFCRNLPSSFVLIQNHEVVKTIFDRKKIKTFSTAQQSPWFYNELRDWQSVLEIYPKFEVLIFGQSWKKRQFLATASAVFFSLVPKPERSQFGAWKFYLPLCIVSLTIFVLEQSACMVSTVNNRSKWGQQQQQQQKKQNKQIDENCFDGNCSRLWRIWRHFRHLQLHSNFLV